MTDNERPSKAFVLLVERGDGTLESFSDQPWNLDVHVMRMTKAETISKAKLSQPLLLSTATMTDELIDKVREVFENRKGRLPFALRRPNNDAQAHQASDGNAADD